MDNWIPTDNIILEENALLSIKSEKNVLVYAGPGAGKTELLAQKASYLFHTKKLKNNRKILAISFKKDSAANLFDRVSKRSKLASENFQSMTFDSFAKKILDQFILGLPNAFRPSIDYYIDDKIKETAFEIYRGLTKCSNDYETKTKVLKFIESKYIDELAEIGQKTWSGMLKLSPSRLSFPMITLLVIELLKKNPNLKKALQFTFQYVFLDEFQDTTSPQYQLVKLIFANSDTLLTAVGDEKQRIMVWAGADKKVFNNFINDFNATTLPLLFNHRSAPILIEIQKKFYAHLNQNSENINANKKWEPNAGKLFLYEFAEEEKEADCIVEYISEKIKSGIKPREICILAKQLPSHYAYKVIEKLNAINVSARIEVDYQDLLKENVIILLLSTIKLIFNIQDSEAWNIFSDFIEETQDFELGFLRMNEIDNLFRSIKMKYVNLDNTTFPYFISEILDFLGIHKIKLKYKEYEQGQYFENILSKFIKLFVDDSSNINIHEGLDKFLGNNSIPIMTIHKSKGLEYNSVIFMGLEDSAFWNFKNQPEEDKCSFFVALSRAKEEIIFTFSQSRLKSKYPNNIQRHNDINELYEFLSQSELVNYRTFD